jgi:DNA-directed RNA polymerase specialized sigma24 family protein
VAISSRRKERLREVSQLIRRLGVPTQPDPTDAPMDSELLRELHALPPKQAAAVVLRYFHGYSNREIGQSLGVPERTVASRLIRARARLHDRLKEDDYSPLPRPSPSRGERGEGDTREWRTSLAPGVPSDE